MVELMNTNIIILVVIQLLAQHAEFVAPKKCKDSRKDCPHLASIGYCKKTQTAMERLCPQSCGICETNKPVTTPSTMCQDTMRGCNIMLKKGFCVKFKDQMKTRCQKTCGFCPRCYDKRQDCDRYKRFGWCDRKQKEMADSCPKTCNLCYMVKPTPSPKAICLDQRNTIQCQKMARLGFCESRPAMKTVCTKTCGVCGGGAKGCNKIPTLPPTTPASQQRVTGAHCHDRYGRARCEYYAHIGWCEKHEKIKKHCTDTCVCNYKKPTVKPISGDCTKTRFGCCWDKKTIKTDSSGSSCPDCKDDRRFAVLCQRFGGDCDGNAALAKSLRKHCSKTCNLC